MGRNRNNNSASSLVNRSPQQFSGPKRGPVAGQYLPIMPKGESPTPSDLGYSSPTRPISQDALLMSPPSLMSPGSLASNVPGPQDFSRSMTQGIQRGLHRGISPYHPLNSLILAAQLHPQYSLLSLSMSHAMNKVDREAEEKREERKDSFDDDDREPGELVIKEEEREDEEPTEERPKESDSGLSSIRKVLDSVNSNVTKHKFEEVISHATADTILKSTSMTDDLKCQLCNSSFNTTVEAIHHNKLQCPRRREVSNATEHYSGRLIEGLAAKLHEIASSNNQQSLVSHQIPLNSLSMQHQEDFQVSRPLKRTKEEDCTSDADSGHVVDDEETTSDGKKVRVRSHIREEQLAVLRAHYASNSRPKKDELQAIAEKIRFPVRVVQVWFQNARARDRREGRASTPIPAAYVHSSQMSYSSCATPNSILQTSTHQNLSSPLHYSPASVHSVADLSPSSHSFPSITQSDKIVQNRYYRPSVLASGIPYSLTNGWSSPNHDEIENPEDDVKPLDLSTKKHSPSPSPKPLSVVSDSDGDTTASLAISYKSESRTPTPPPPQMNDEVRDSKEDILTTSPDHNSKLAQILRGAKFNMTHPIYSESYECSDKRPRVSFSSVF